MAKLTRLILLFASFVVGSVCVARPLDDSWKLAGEVDGIKVYGKPISEGGVTEFRSKAIVQADLVTTAATLMDGTNFSKWVDGCLESKEVDRNILFDPKAPLAGQYNVIYGVNAAPWPLSNRDFTVRAVMNLEKEAQSGNPVISFTGSAVDAKVPLNPDYVRVTTMVVNINLTPAPGDANATEVDFGLGFDGKVSGPKSVQEVIAVQSPPKSLQRLKKFMQAPHFDPKLVETLKQRIGLLK